MKKEYDFTKAKKTRGEPDAGRKNPSHYPARQRCPGLVSPGGR